MDQVEAVLRQNFDRMHHVTRLFCKDLTSPFTFGVGGARVALYVAGAKERSDSFRLPNSTLKFLRIIAIDTD